MKGMCYAMVCFISIFCGLAANVAAGPNQQTTDTVDSPYDRLVGDNQQGARYGWIPTIESVNEHRDIKRRYTRSEQRRRESLRRAYTGEFRTTPYSALSKTKTVASFPKIIQENGDADKNFCVMITASWCLPCKRMYSTIKRLRKEGYIFYVFDIESEDFKDYDALFDTTKVPTFIIFDKGKEVKRTIGTTKEEWFREQLKTRAEQTPVPEPVNPYDEV